MLYSHGCERQDFENTFSVQVIRSNNHTTKLMLYSHGCDSQELQGCMYADRRMVVTRGCLNIAMHGYLDHEHYL